ncbi:MAG: SWIM zinc finger family protein [Deltaproteobacteria bacterium]|nr:SWIM zinc finger family protein [Deltaproteobacteria bacterium]
MTRRPETERTIERTARSPFVLRPEALAALASERIVARGIAYARAGRVQELREQGRRLEARVLGSNKEPYLVRLEHDGEELVPSCTCPFDWEPFCKHAVAVLAARARIEAAPARPAASVRELELHVRRRRGETGGFRFRTLTGDGVLGSFEVRSPSGERYEVWVRSFAERLNRCSCPDYATSMLGTCKHIEAVLAGLTRRAKRRVAALRAGRGLPSMVVVTREDTPRIVARLAAEAAPALRRLAARWFDAAGGFRGDPVDELPRMLEEAARFRKLVVYPDVEEFSREVAERRRMERRREEVRAWFGERQGRVSGVRAKLYPYQVEGAAFLAGAGRALLADDMGLGKTVQAIVAARALFERGEIRRTLVVCPASLKHQWASEIARFAGLDAVVVEGGRAARREACERRAPFTIANYELLVRGLDLLPALEPDLLIVDEAQRIKNWRTLTAARIKSIRTRFAFVLTGTPLENRLDDLYSILQLVSPLVLGPLWAFNEQFLVREPGKVRPTGYKNLGELRRRLRPVMLRRDRKEVLTQLPERIDARYEVALWPEQRELMLDHEQQAAAIAARGRKRPLTPKELEQLAMHLQLARMACNAASLLEPKARKGSPKLEEFARLVEDVCVDGGRKAVVFSQFEVFQRLAAEVADRLDVGYVRLHGGVPSHKRGGLIERFRDDPECKLFFSTDAGGVGLNLQFASTMINLEYPWNPAVLEQRIGRVHRLGQKEPVNVILLVAEDSTETRIERILGSKRGLFEAAILPGASVDEVQAPQSCLSLAQIMFVDREAVEETLAAEGTAEPPKEVGEATLPATAAAAGRQAATTASMPEPGVCRAQVAVEAPAPTAPPGRAGVTPPSPSVSAAIPAVGPAAAEAARLPAILGYRLDRVVELGDGRMVAVVDSVDEVTRGAAESCGAVAMPLAAVEPLSLLGDASPFARAKVVATGLAEHDAEAARGREAAALARRKLRAAEAMLGAELPAEAIVAARDAMVAAVGGLAAGASEPDLPAARLLFEVLVPAGRLTLERAALVAKADGLARAYGSAAMPPPAATARSVLEDARRVVGDLEP